MGVCEEKTQLEGSRHSDDLGAEVEESPLLEAVTRERLVKTKDLACAVVIGKPCRLAMELQLRVITSCVLKWPINQISIPKPRRYPLRYVTI
jgi:hypothetical protein